MRKNQDPVKEYVRVLSDDQLKFLYTRFIQRFGGDISEVVGVLNQSREVDQLLGEASDNRDFFARLDHVEALVQGEYKRRSQHERSQHESKERERAESRAAR